MDTNVQINMGEAASAYAKAGYAVFPIHTIVESKCTCGQTKGCKPAKHPVGSLVPRGVLDATVDPSTIKRWWTHMPSANIGIATGKPSNLVILDIDGEKGEATLAELERQHGPLPPTWQVKTGKGRHLYFLYPKDLAKVKSVARVKLGIDVRADGGYILGAPSLHESGKRYAVTNNAAIADCPSWVVDYANGKPKGSLPPASVGRFVLNAFEGKSPASIFAANPMNDNLSDGIWTQTATIPLTPREGARLKSALAYIPSGERDTWRDVGFALHSLGWGDKGYVIWADWSRSSPEKYDENDQIKTWESFDRPYDGPRITVATIFYMAAQRGWRDETQTLDFHTDLGNARHLVARHGQNTRYIPEWRKWITWRDDRWEIDTDGAIMRLAKETVEALFSDAVQLAAGGERDALLKHAIKSQAEARLKAMVSLAESEASVVVAAKKAGR